jgi:hypothetical protein
MAPGELERQLCAAFCAAVQVRPVPSGFAVSSAFEDSSGDRITFYLSETLDGWRIEDDGDYLAHLIARDIAINEGTRGQLLDAILEQGHAYWDRETFEIRSTDFAVADLPRRTTAFLSSLIRVRDLELLTRENVRSTFREDVISAMKQRFGGAIEVVENAAVANDFAEFPADLIVRPALPDSSARPGSIYLVNTNDKLNEALLAHQEAQLQHRTDFAVIAMIEEPDMRVLSRKRFQRAQNRALSMPIFRGDEDAAMSMVARELRLPARAAFN